MKIQGESNFQIFEHRLQRAGREIVLLEVVFSNAKSRNSLTLEAARELKQLVHRAKKSDALLFRADGRVFCAGGNIKDHIAMGPAKSKKGNREITDVCESLSDLGVPTLALVEGDVLGGGIELLSCFDIVISTPFAYFGFWQRRLGLTFGWGGGARLEKRIGRAAVARLGIQARALTGREALHAGLVDRVIAPWQIRSEGFAELIRVSALPKNPVSIMKANARRLSHGAESRVGFEKLWFAPEHREQMKKFADKKPPSRQRR